MPFSDTLYIWGKSIELERKLQINSNNLGKSNWICPSVWVPKIFMILQRNRGKKVAFSAASNLDTLTEGLFSFHHDSVHDKYWLLMAIHDKGEPHTASCFLCAMKWRMNHKAPCSLLLWLGGELIARGNYNLKGSRLFCKYDQQAGEQKGQWITVQDHACFEPLIAENMYFGHHMLQQRIGRRTWWHFSFTLFLPDNGQIERRRIVWTGGWDMRNR